MDERQWQVVEITSLGDPGQRLLVMYGDKSYELVKRHTRTQEIEVWGDWTWAE